MKHAVRSLVFAFVLAAIAVLAPSDTVQVQAQSGCPVLQFGVVPTPAQWQSCFQGKNDALGYTPVNRAGDTMQGKLTTIASGLPSAGFNLPTGVAPTSPTDGDIWVTSGGVFGRVNGVTVALGTAATPGVTSVTAGDTSLTISPTTGAVVAQVATAGVTNAKMANMAAGTVKCKPLGASAGAPQDCGYTTINVLDAPYNADPTGAADSAAAINSAIAALPVSGGDIVIGACGTYKLNSTVVIGNGTTSAVSTRYGVRIRGTGVPTISSSTPTFNGYSSTPCVKFTWGGAGGGTMFQVAGPLRGWGLENVFFDCGSSALNGVQVISAGFGDIRNLAVENCTGNAIASTSNPLGGYTAVGNVDSLRNNWTNISILVPNIASAKGVTLTGASDHTSDTDYNIWTNLLIRSTGAGTTNFGIYLQVADANFFYGVSTGTGFGTGSVGLTLDYSVNNNFPNNNTFYNFEIGAATNYANVGSPNAALFPNRFFGAVTDNGTNWPTLAGTETSDGPWRDYTPSPSCGTASFTTNSAKFKTFGRDTRTEFDITISGIGTGCANQIILTTPFTANSSGGLIGRETVLTFKPIVCNIVAGANTFSCVHSDLSNFQATERITASGIVEAN